MIWLIGVAAIALMLIVLAIEPSQLAGLGLTKFDSKNNVTKTFEQNIPYENIIDQLEKLDTGVFTELATHSQQWQNASYMFLAVCLLTCVSIYLLNVFFLQFRQAPCKQQTSKNPFTPVHFINYTEANFFKPKYPEQNPLIPRPLKPDYLASIRSNQQDLVEDLHPTESICKAKYQQKQSNVKNFKLFKKFSLPQILNLLLKIIGLLSFFLAVLTNSVAQRIETIAKSVNQTVYVEAIVTPIGISDRPLIIEPSQQDNVYQIKSRFVSKPVVSQGYRQLVKLTNIKKYSELADIENSSYKNYRKRHQKNSQNNTTLISSDEKGDSENTTTNKNVVAKSNPFYSINNTGDKNTTRTIQNLEAPAEYNHKVNKLGNMNGKKAADNLPEEMTVMLSSFKAKELWLNQLSPDKQIIMRLELTPLQFKNTVDYATDFNEYRWLSTRDAVATAKLISANPNDIKPIKSLNIWQKINTLRYKLRQHFIGLNASKDVLKIQHSVQYKSNTHLAQNPVVSSTHSEADNPTSSFDSNFEGGFNDRDTRENDSTNVRLLNLDSDYNQARAVVLSLLTGDRSLINRQTTELYRFAGISHLLAISGTHVLFLAILLAAITSLIVSHYIPNLFRYLPRWQVAFVIAVISAFIYAMFAGFDVPAARTAWMLLLIGILRYFLMSSSVLKVLLLLAVAMAFNNVFVLWQAGFWLSFIAVAALIVYSQRWGGVKLKNQVIPATTKNTKLNQTQHMTLFDSAKTMVIEFIKLQLWMSIALLPISLWLFGKVSLWGFLVNLFAIGLFGWVIVPLNLLAAVLYPILPKIADLIWRLLIWLLETFHILLLKIKMLASQTGWIHSDISFSLLLLLLFLALPWMLPKGVLSRLFYLPVIGLLAILPFINTNLDTRLTNSNYLLAPNYNTQNSNTPNSNNNQLNDIPIKITPLKTSNSQLSATLISSSQGVHWLLLSAYQPSYFKTAKNSSNQTDHIIFSATQLERLKNEVYDQLKLNNINALNGVIGQTATPQLAKLVANLREDVVIYYYWQAGYKAYEKLIDNYLYDTKLSAQSCSTGKQWQAFNDTNNKNKIKKINGLDSDPQYFHEATHFNIMAVSGWQEINDKAVWDCSVLIQSSAPVLLKQSFIANGGQAYDYLQLPSTVIEDAPFSYSNSYSQHLDASDINSFDLSKIEANHDRGKVNSSETHSLNITNVILHSSNEAKLVQLWQLMCEDNQSSINNNEFAGDNIHYVTNQNLKNSNWLMTAQAFADNSFIDKMQPITFYIIGNNSHAKTAKLKETRLYWQELNNSHSP